MPELPDVEVYVDCLRDRVLGRPLERLRIGTPFVLRSISPPPDALEGREVAGLARLGKRIVIELSDEHFIVIHLMIAGRLRWRDRGVKLPRKRGLAAFDFPVGTLLLTEEGSKKRASMHLVAGRAGLAEHDRGGLEPLSSTVDTFREALTRESHTLKRTLTDPRLFSGIGNAYSDEILHAAGLSPMKLSRKLSPEEVARLHEATVTTLERWVRRLRDAVGDGFPEKVTAFPAGMAVHGRYREPCPTCGSTVQRIVYASNEANYCATCQTGGRLLADRAMSRLLRDDWPKTLDAWEDGVARRS